MKQTCRVAISPSETLILLSLLFAFGHFVIDFALSFVDFDFDWFPL